VFAPIVLLGDQSPVSGQAGFRRDDCRDFPKKATPERHRLGRQAPALIVVQPETLSSELLPQYPVFLAEVIDRVALLLVQPTGDGNHEPSKRVEGPAHWQRTAAKIIVTGSRNRMIWSRSSFWTLRESVWCWLASGRTEVIFLSGALSLACQFLFWPGIVRPASGRFRRR